ncbi:sensor histidine kinase [Amycolatopsis viridis]|uniref:Two-component system sensor histidine kinase DesK n=1 Tax=Amycolatopsis viridis TaxID=185678 RepID=A0ABX0SUP0_9PSEU|nr:sensor histidine kinase [Amycolatopsis viridis]NIH80687.1 two-component system sensor histidine kinase DesK [Amycolatopsis viridis]
MDELRGVDERRRLLLSLGMLCYPFLAAAGVNQYAHGAGLVVGYLLLVAISGCYLALMIASMRSAWRVYWWLVAVMTVLAVLLAPLAHEGVLILAAVIVPSAAARVGVRTAVAVVALGAATCVVVPMVVPGWNTGGSWYFAVAVVFTALLVLAFSRTATANQQLREARAEVARLASEAERNRIARDLHDLLGHSLTAITVKSALARRLDPDAARAEMESVEQLARQALSDVRAAVSGYQDVTLAGELAKGRELLRAAGVAADLPTACDVVPPRRQELFGWVVREGVTNVVRHARAGRCTVELTASSVEVRDDGVGGPPGEGSGLDGLRARVTAAGGVLTAGPTQTGGWSLRVEAA